MSEKKVLVLEAKQQSLFQYIQKCYDLSLKADESVSNRKDFLISLEDIENNKIEFLSVTEKINLEKCSSVKDFVPSFKVLESYQNLYCFVKYKEKEINNHFTPAKAENTKVFSNFKIPKLELTSFSGDPSNWSVFYQNFKSVIHDNTALSNTQKIQYLIPQLSGKALNVCAGIPATGENYDIIWDTLVQRYEDKRFLLTHYIDQILGFRPINAPTPAALDAFSDKFSSAVAALKSVDVNDLADFIITHIALSKLDKETLYFFEQKFRNSNLPNFKELDIFIREQSKIISRTYNNNPHFSKSKSKTNNNLNFLIRHNNVATSSDNNKCLVCMSERHPLFKCSQFMSASPFERRQIVERISFCTNCLGYHNIKKCKSQLNCRFCNRNHHSLLCFANSHYSLTKSQQRSADDVNKPPSAAPHTAPPARSLSPSHTSHSHAVSLPRDNLSGARALDSQRDPPTSTANNISLITSNFTLESNSNRVNLLPTAKVIVYNMYGNPCQVRLLIDSCSMANFITESCCKRLNIPILNDSSTVRGIGSSTRPIKGKTRFNFHSVHDITVSYTIDAFVLNKITDNLPSSVLDGNMLTHFDGLLMADDTFNIPNEIDGIIGAELFPYLLCKNRIITPNSQAVGVETTLGYVVMGSSLSRSNVGFNNNNFKNNESFLCTLNDYNNLDTIVRKFWEVENLNSTPILSASDLECEDIFVKNYIRDCSGRYTVVLPFKSNPSLLGDSANTALKRFSYLERKFAKHPEIRIAYNEVMQEYINKGYLTQVKNPCMSTEHYYIPHHAVYRSDKITTKVRIVLDASCKSSKGNSLNDLLHCGTNLQANIFDILINLRLFKYTLSADVEKMFFQVALHNDHHKFQRIFFRFQNNEPISTYEFTRVSFGTKASPFLALRVIQQLIEDEKLNFPTAAMYIKNAMYMDDYINSFPSIELAKTVYSELVQLFAAGGFKLTKWLTNSTHLLNHIPTSNRTPQLINFDESAETKLVGLRWSPIEDYFSFEVKEDLSKTCTKRHILATTARYYDPLGLIAPVVAYMKLMVQECWKCGLGWDDPVPPYILSSWTKFKSQLNVLEKIRIPRHIGICSSSHVFLIGFCDASEKCYGAAVYVRVSEDNCSPGQTALLCSKSKLAPLKNISLARLELCAAYLLSKLLKLVRDIIETRCKVSEVFAFSDSTVALSWIHSEPYKWHTFISNRVSLIQSNLDQSHWFHVSSCDNPSDVLSRPAIPERILNNNLWFKGPAWTSLPVRDWPITVFKQNNLENIPEFKTQPQSLLVHTTDEPLLYTIASRASTWSRMLNITVYILRFIRKLTTRGQVTVNDLEIAESAILQCIQNRHFSNDISALTSKKEVTPGLRKLTPFFADGILRVGGRLKNSDLSYGQKHPIILPANDKIVELIIKHYHCENLHTGPNLVMSLLRQRYWILNSRNNIRKIIHSCNTYMFSQQTASSLPFDGPTTILQSHSSSEMFYRDWGRLCRSAFRYYV